MSLLSDRFPTLRTDQSFVSVLESHCTFRTVEAGATLVKRMHPVSEIYLVLRGSLKAIREHDSAHELLLYYVHPGETCSLSLSACLNGQRSSIVTRAEEKTELAVVKANHVSSWMREWGVWGDFVHQCIHNRTRELLRVIDLLAFSRMDQRLLHYLREKADAHDATVVYATHQDIAYELNTSREVISRLLKQMERDGTLSLGRNRIRMNMPQLHELAE